jgi:adenylate cyclase class IV
LSDGETSEDGEAIAHDLMRKLGISSNQLIEGSYLDLIHRMPNNPHLPDCDQRSE